MAKTSTLVQDIAKQKYNFDRNKVTLNDFAYGMGGGPTKLKTSVEHFGEEDVRFLLENAKNGNFEWRIYSNILMGGQVAKSIGVHYYTLSQLSNDKELTKEQIKLYMYYVTHFYGKSIGVEGSSDRDSVLKLLVEKHEDELFNIIALDEFKFENFDKLIVVLMNKYLESNPPVVGLEYAVKAHVDMIGLDPYYTWSTDASKQLYGVGEEGLFVYENKIEYIDMSLRRTEVNSFLEPFDALKGDEYTVEARFEEGSRFSSLSISNISQNTDAWFFKGYLNKEVSIRKSYTKFIVDLFDLLELQKNGEWKFDIGKIKRVFENAAALYLDTTVNWKVGDGIGIDIDYDANYSLKQYLAKKILDDFRLAAFRKAAEDLKILSMEELLLLGDDDLKAKQFAAGEAAATNSEVFDRDPNAPDDDELTQEQIEERQKFLKQCALMTRLDLFAKEHVTSVVRRARKENNNQISTNYNRRRYYMVRDGDHEQQGTVTKLLLPRAESIEEFLEIEPSTHAYLIPKLRFFKVVQKGGVLTESEFKFRNFTSADRVNSLKDQDPPYDKGGDFGVKEFSVSFEGATPATAKNDVKANLSLYFQSFDDFINKQPENEYPFVDMLLMPKADEEKANKKGSGRESRFQFQPDYYRIRVDMGWMIPEKNHGDLSKVIGEDRYKQLKTALLKTNKSFYLNMVDHTIDFRDDGSVQIGVEYRAYIESATKGSILDALSSKESRAALNKTRLDYERILEKDECSIKELSNIKRQLLQIEDLLKKFSYQSIMKRLIKNNMLFHKKLDAQQAMIYHVAGVFTQKVKFHKEKGEPNSFTNLTEATQGLTFDFGNEFFKEDLNNSKDYLNLNYFYLGDLLYVIMDCLYEDDGKNYIQGYENFKFILGSLQYEDLFDSKTRLKVVNIGSIPISAELFFEWFTQNVVKPQRSSYPIMYFIRDLCKYLVTEILSENCFRTTLDKKIQFHTTNFVGIGDKLAGLLHMSDPVIDLQTQYNNDRLPLESDRARKVSINEYVNYIMIYVDTPRLSIKGKTGDKADDGDIGIYHYQIGKPRGLLKKLKFSKTDAKYLREARYFRNGYDGLMQLANVYNVNLEMIGNTLYYPGMEVYINPLGFMGAKTKEFDPTEGAPNRSVANRLGFGGYHLVTNVQSTIAPGRFVTQVTALYHYSGDGDVASINLGEASEIKGLDEEKEVSKRTKKQKRACEADYNKIINIALDIDNNKLETYPGIDDYVYGSVSTTGVESVKPTQPPLGVTYAPVVPEVVSNNLPTATNAIPSAADIINKMLSPEAKAPSPYTETELVTNRKYYIENGKKYYENGEVIDA